MDIQDICILLSSVKKIGLILSYTLIITTNLLLGKLVIPGVILK